MHAAGRLSHAAIGMACLEYHLVERTHAALVGRHRTSRPESCLQKTAITCTRSQGAVRIAAEDRPEIFQLSEARIWQLPASVSGGYLAVRPEHRRFRLSNASGCPSLL